MSKVLLVDDNPTQLGIRETLLRAQGLDVSTATTVDEALEMLTRADGSFGVVVTDHVMPGRTGAEFVRELRRVDPSVPVLVITGMGDAEEEYEGLNVAFRQKPCPPPELIGLVKAALHKGGS